jgi:L-threonylcarbamoyladenylate synthase
MILLSDDRVVERTVACLESGGVALLPTDTVYGLAVHPVRGATAVPKLFTMKRRPIGRNLPIMVSSAGQIKTLGARVTAEAERLLAAFSPGPLTVALGVDPALTPPWLHGRVEIGTRIPDDIFLLEVLDRTGPLLVTSANLHSQVTPEEVGAVLAALDGVPDLVVDGGPRMTVPSTLVNCNLPSPVIERPGAVPEEKILEVLA